MGDASSSSIRETMETTITVTLKDGSKKSIPKGTKLQALADDDAIAAQVNGGLIDLSQTLDRDASVSFISVHSKKGSIFYVILRLTSWLRP